MRSCLDTLNCRRGQTSNGVQYCKWSGWKVASAAFWSQKTNLMIILATVTGDKVVENPKWHKTDGLYSKFAMQDLLCALNSASVKPAGYERMFIKVSVLTCNPPTTNMPITLTGSGNVWVKMCHFWFIKNPGSGPWSIAHVRRTNRRTNRQIHWRPLI